jgi:hypothetical protein
MDKPTLALKSELLAETEIARAAESGLRSDLTTAQGVITGLTSDVESLKAGGVWRATFATYADLIAAYPSLDVSTTTWFENDDVDVLADESETTTTHTQGNPSIYRVTVSGDTKTLKHQKDETAERAVQQFTNDAPGVFKGNATTPGFVSAQVNGEGKVNGWDDKANKTDPAPGVSAVMELDNTKDIFVIAKAQAGKSVCEYIGYDLINAPISGESFYYTVYQYQDDNWTRIVARRFGDNDTFEVYQTNGTWGTWQKNATTLDSVSGLRVRPATGDIHTWLPTDTDGLFYMDAHGQTNQPPVSTGDLTDWWHYVGMAHNNANGFLHIVAYSLTQPTVRQLEKSCYNGVWTDWREVAHKDDLNRIALPNYSAPQAIAGGNKTGIDNDGWVEVTRWTATETCYVKFLANMNGVTGAIAMSIGGNVVSQGHVSDSDYMFSIYYESPLIPISKGSTVICEATLTSGTDIMWSLIKFGIVMETVG